MVKRKAAIISLKNTYSYEKKSYKVNHFLFFFSLLYLMHTYRWVKIGYLEVQTEEYPRPSTYLEIL